MRRIKAYSVFAYLYIIFVISTGLSSTHGNNSGYPEEIRISTKQKKIMVGEPLLLQMAYIPQRPRLMPATQKPFRSIMHEAIVQIEDPNGNLTRLMLFPRFIYLDDSKGLRYKGNFVVFYDGSNRKLVFEKTGDYNILVFVTDIHSSNTLNVSVQVPSRQQSVALSQLQSPSDYFFRVQV